MTTLVPFIKKNIDYIFVPLFFYCLLYLPGYILVNYFDKLYVDNLILRQITYICYSVGILMSYNVYNFMSNKHQLVVEE